jgi:FkbM family methyltransferase
MTSNLVRKTQFRLRWLLWRMLTLVSPVHRSYTFRLPDGSRFEYPLASAIGMNLFAGWFEPAEINFVRSQVRPGDVVLDLGANAGLYTVLTSRLVGEAGHVYAFEPGARAVVLLRRNIALNGLTNVTVINAAVSNETGHASFGEASDTAMSSLASISRDDQHIEGWQTVRTLRLDDAVTEYGIRPATFIKMDVEGAEKLAIEGAERTLAEARTLTILFEAFEDNARAFGYTVRELLNGLAARGFSLQAFDGNLTLRPVESIDSASLGTTVYNFVARRAARPIDEERLTVR